MKTILLKLNYLLFPWYYNRVSEHFKQWTFIRSVDLLRQNYEHDKILIENSYKNNKALIEECYRLRKENASLRMNQVATPDQISNLNRMFGSVDQSDFFNNTANAIEQSDAALNPPKP